MSCQNTDTIAQGADLTVDIPLRDKNNQPVDASLLAKLVVVVYHANRTVIAKFSSNPAFGYEEIDTTLGALGTITIKLLSSHTLAAPTGKIMYEVHGQYTATSISDDGVEDIVKTEQYLCNIIPSMTGGDTLP